MKKIKYSFIIPAYNSEKTIEKCLNKIQDDIKTAELEDEAEIIVVENSSKDNTTSTVENYVKKEKINNIHLIHSEKGVSRARNEGIKKAQGKYLIFVDSDDLWLKGSLRKIEEDINKNESDLYAYSFIKGTEQTNDTECAKVIHDIDKIKSYSFEEKVVWMMSKPTHRMQVWAKVFRKKIIDDQNIRYNENLRYSEDSEFLIRYLLNCKNIEISCYPIYKYTISIGSVMRSADDTRINGYIDSMKLTEKVLKNESESIKIAFSKYVMSHLNIILVHDVFEVINKIIKNKKLKATFQKMRDLFKMPIFNKNLKKLKLKDCLDKTLLPQFFYKIHLPILTAILCYLKSYLNLKKETN